MTKWRSSGLNVRGDYYGTPYIRWSHCETGHAPPNVGPPPTFPIMEVVTGCHVQRKMSHFEANMHNELVGKPNHHVHRVPGNV